MKVLVHDGIGVWLAARRLNAGKFVWPAEGAPPSGRVSVEHVLNVLGRLNAAPAPENAATTLKVATPPLADTARYDSLRAHAEETDHA